MNPSQPTEPGSSAGKETHSGAEFVLREASGWHSPRARSFPPCVPGEGGDRKASMYDGEGRVSTHPGLLLLSLPPPFPSLSHTQAHTDEHHRDQGDSRVAQACVCECTHVKLQPAHDDEADV